MTTNGSLYLSGAMEFAADGQLGADWRILCSNELRKLNFTPLDITAMDVSYTKVHDSLIDCTVRGVTGARELLTAKANIRHHFVLADLNLIDRHSDALIIKYDAGVRRGAGTISECQHAFNHEIPIFLVNTYQDPNEIPGWLYALTTKVFNTFEELYEYLAALPQGILKLDAYGNRRSNNHYLCSLCGTVEEKHGDYFVSKVSPTYCKSCVDVVKDARELNQDRYQFFVKYMNDPTLHAPAAELAEPDWFKEQIALLDEPRDWYDKKNSVQVGSTVHKMLTHPRYNQDIFLGGSRRMQERWIEENGNTADLVNPFSSIGSTTDWDFFATHSLALQEHLVLLGFKETDYSKIVNGARLKNFENLTDEELDTLDILRSEGEYALDDEAITILSKDNVQIVMRNDALFYKRVFDNIDFGVYETFLWKSSPTAKVERTMIQPFFNMLFKIAHAAESN